MKINLPAYGAKRIPADIICYVPFPHVSDVVDNRTIADCKARFDNPHGFRRWPKIGGGDGR
jgi:hypothetical protein